MKISINWLKTLINTNINSNQIAELLTDVGLEVEGIEHYDSIEGGLKGLVVGQIVSCEKHPDADRLNLTKVDIGAGELLNIVCGAPNVVINQKVIVATIGAKLFPISGESFEIKKSKIRGQLSEGMICAEDEIGLGKSHDGIMILDSSVAIGTPAANYFKLESDTILEIGLTPNRSDAASHLGVSRDLAAVLNTQNNSTEFKTKLIGLNELPKASNTFKIEIDIQNTSACKRYSGLIIENIIVKQSPDWLKNRLQSIGLRSINNIVDITNFVMHEMGQPLHAFDLNKISGNKIVVRNANKNEKFRTLDGIERTLTETDLMICDVEKPMCLAGIFGGLESGVTETTTSIFLESAFFDSGTIRKSSKHHALKTDASFRFERGTDPNITVFSLTRAANLILELAEGNISMDIVDVYPETLESHKVAFSYQNCTDLIGKEIDRLIIKTIILSLEIEIISEGADGMLLSVPRYKTDVTREADVIEEVMRIYGYNNVEVSKSISYTVSHEKENKDVALENKISATLIGFGCNEIMSLSLTKESYYPTENTNVKIVNALSNDLTVMRSDMLFSGLEAIAYNLNRKNSDLKLFEIGRIYNALENNSYKEDKKLSIFLCGNMFNENPYHLNQKSDFTYLKALVDNVLIACGVINYKSVESNYANFEMGLTYLLNAKPLLEMGNVSNAVLKKFDISMPVYYANFNWEVLLKAVSKQKIVYEEVSKLPSVRRDLALLIDKKIKFSQIEELAFATERKFLKAVNLFDIYEDKKLGDKKSYAVSFTLLNNEATLNDKQIETVMEKLIINYREKLGAELR